MFDLIDLFAHVANDVYKAKKIIDLPNVKVDDKARLFDLLRGDGDGDLDVDDLKEWGSNLTDGASEVFEGVAEFFSSFF